MSFAFTTANILFLKHFFIFFTAILLFKSDLPESNICSVSIPYSIALLCIILIISVCPIPAITVFSIVVRFAFFDNSLHFLYNELFVVFPDFSHSAIFSFSFFEKSIFSCNFLYSLYKVLFDVLFSFSNFSTICFKIAFPQATAPLTTKTTSCSLLKMSFTVSSKSINTFSFAVPSSLKSEDVPIFITYLI